ncbi:MAG: hypothetical protein IMZ62_07775 [Chloroflexi bacterium]|nr:hypothetical protein [Chloroflexota bacterium]
MADQFLTILKRLLRNPLVFAESASGLKLRRYQEQVATAVVNSIMDHQGLTFVVMFPRQSGKNELQAQIEAFILLLLSESNPSAEIVKVSPTWKPQSLNAMRRLERVLTRNLITRSMWTKESCYIYRVGSARIYFFSGSPEASIVGATASTLLEVDEAQDVEISKFDKDIAPMAASTNATRVFWGTAWSSRTLLARELAASHEAEQRDGIRRTFVINADQVSLEVPAYGLFVSEQVARLGRNHPMVKTQFYSETIDSEAGMFPPARIALIRGDHSAISDPQSAINNQKSKIFAFLVDVAGQDENFQDPSQSLANPKRDSTVLTVVEIDLATVADPLIKRPTYNVVYRRSWTGVSHTDQYASIKALADLWRPRHVVVDATGIGASLASFLDRALPGKVIPFTFTSSSKSKLGWDFLACIETGRFKDYNPADPAFLQQLAFCSLAVQPGPGHLIKWSVPDNTRDPATGDLVHDDLVLSAALVAVLDEQPWTPPGQTLVIPAADPILSMDIGF